MPWVAPIVGYTDELGYLYCATCRPHGPGWPVPGDGWFSEDEKCERCGRQLEHVSTDEYVYVESGAKPYAYRPAVEEERT